MPSLVSTTPLLSRVDKFLDYLKVEKGSSPLTVRNYKHYLYRFSNWITKTYGNLDITDVSLNNVRGYRVYLSELKDPKGNNLSKRTQGYHIIGMRSFLKWLIKNDVVVLAPEKLDLPKTDDRQVKFLSGDQVDRLLAAPSLSSLAGKRDKAMLEVLFSTGLRVSELTKLDRDKIDLERREFGIIGKGGRARVVFLSNRAADWVKSYILARKDNSQALFIRHRGKVDISASDDELRLTHRSVQRMVKKYVKKIKLPVDATVHTIRHSYATDLLIAGADLRSVQEMLGHKNVSTTQIYTHVTNKQLKTVHEAFHRKGK